SKSVNITSHGGQDGFVARLDRNGKLVWVGDIGGGDDDFMTALAVGPDGDVYCAGTVRLVGDIDPSRGVRNITTKGVDDTFIERLDASSGKLKWSRVYGEDDTTEGVNGMNVDDQGNVFVAGVFNNTVRFDRKNPKFDRSSSGGNDVYLAKLNG